MLMICKQAGTRKCRHDGVMKSCYPHEKDSGCRVDCVLMPDSNCVPVPSGKASLPDPDKPISVLSCY